MDVGSVVSAIKESIGLVNRLRETSKKKEQVELKATLAELANRLADANMRMSALKDEIAVLKEENKALTSRAEGEKPKVKWGCYVFNGDNNLYCPACFDAQGRRYLTTRVDSRKRQCSVCRTTLFS